MSKFSMSDYGGMKAGRYWFNYGYEQLICEKHPKGDSECEECQWAFTADVDGKEVFRTAIKDVKDQFNCDECLLEGIRMFIESRNEP